MDKISTVDISSIGLHVQCPTEESYKTVGLALDKAFSEIGFVFLTGHGVDGDEKLIQDAMSASREFFLQDLEVKRVISREEQEGWVEQGREIFDQAEDGSVAVHEVREAFDIHRLDPEARFPDLTHPQFRTLYTTLAERSIMLSQRLLRSLSVVLAQPHPFLSDHHTRILAGDNASALRTLFYPPITGTLPKGHIRCGEHSDYGTFTLLFQDKYPGLQVKSARGTWVNADPVEGAITVNIGDLLEMWTGGRYPATLHRVGIPSEEKLRSVARQSIAFFIHPDDEVMVSPLAGPDPKFPPISALDHVTKRFSATYTY